MIIGATGHFGGRICRRIAGEANIELIVTSRSAERAGALARQLREEKPAAHISSASLDHTASNFEESLADFAPDIVIHTAGPFQGQEYRVAKACIACGSHYLDLADGREFVRDFISLDAKAKERGVLLVSGASTLPGLSSAVVDHLKPYFAQIHSIRVTIAPAHQTPRGLGTIRAVLSYCGRPFKVLEKGQWHQRYGWQDLKTERYPLLGTRWSATCDVPDLVLLPDYVPGVRSVSFHAALEAKREQLMLWLMAGLTRLRVIRNWSRFANFHHQISEALINWGGDVGGMSVGLCGIDARGHEKRIAWHLTARQNHGPEIPCTPALILARKLVAEDVNLSGAMPCLGLITLDEFATAVDDLDIEWHVEDSA